MIDEAIRRVAYVLFLGTAACLLMAVGMSSDALAGGADSYAQRREGVLAECEHTKTQKRARKKACKRKNHWREHVTKASWYGPDFQGKKMANGKRFDERKLLAAHRTLPLGTMIRVTNLLNGRSVKVLVADRGPFIGGRGVDLSRRAMQILDGIDDGVIPVRVESHFYN